MAAKKLRAIATPGSTVAAQRYDLYRMAHGRISEAVEAGFYLEAITLIESIATDRLESRLTFLTSTNVGFKNLGPLIQDIRVHETDVALRSIVDADLDAWRVMRNQAVHEMAKLEAGDTTTWEDRVQVLVIVVEEGLAVLRSLKNQLSKLRRAGL